MFLAKIPVNVRNCLCDKYIKSSRNSSFVTIGTLFVFLTYNFYVVNEFHALCYWDCHTNTIMKLYLLSYQFDFVSQ